MNRQFDRAVSRMNRSSGPEQISAIVEAINSLHARHRAMETMMETHMQQMMSGRQLAGDRA